MKHAIKQLDENQLRRTHPLAEFVEEWFFRCEEISAGWYEVEGIDVWGRVISVTEADADELLNKCITEAKSIKAQTKASTTLDPQKTMRGKE